MRLYGMYYACSQYIDLVRKMNIEDKLMGGNKVYFISGWKNKCIILNEVAKITPVRESARKLYETIPILQRDQDKFDITSSVCNSYNAAKRELVIAMQTIITVYETINPKIVDEETIGFDIKLPQFQDIGEFARCLEDLDFMIKHCPYLRQDNSEIKYGSIDVGSTWITFLIAGASAGIMLINLGKIVDYAIKIKSHFVTVKMQEEALRSMQIQNKIAIEVLDTFKEANKILTQQCIDSLKQELGELKDAEEEDKVRRTLEKLGYWMDKGMQIYSKIDAPDEIKDLFPAQEEDSFLSDDLLKLIEMKKENLK